ncbi:nuclear transport factor 2 family protein [Prolixibacteraceae bacterium Z1-6]|uniref:Nuclear transport factor 2 family protein n=1 Tax=Draconibacterium aestuarii TaxID=2998507 RepID=A0A9X3J6P8_9BACT|nr:nuclear transport factor 2 family protein [Prolixibacteraceae bacterium Z1-6]
MKTICIVSVLLVLLFGSCKNQPHIELTEKQKASIENKVKDLYSHAISNLSKMDMEVWSEPWSQNSPVTVNSGAMYFDSFGEFKDSVTQWFSFREKQNVEILHLDAMAFNPKYVLIKGCNKWDITFKNGDTLNADALATLLWKKEEEGWKIIHLHESWQ